MKKLLFLIFGILLFIVGCTQIIEPQSSNQTVSVVWNNTGNITYNYPSLDPIDAIKSSTLNCSVYVNYTSIYVNYSNGTQYNILFNYFKNGVQQNQYTHTVIGNSSPKIIYSNASYNINSSLKRGDRLQCKVKIFTIVSNITGYSSSSGILSSNIVTINNTPPVIVSSSPNGGSYLSPMTVYTNYNTPVVLRWNATDVDNDTLIYLVFYDTFSSWCYQESSNTTNQSGIDTGGCGLNYTGNISTNFTGNVTAWTLENSTDGNWSTYPTTTIPKFKSGLIYGYIYENYTLPVNFSSANGAVIAVKSENSYVLEIRNFSIPYQCLQTTKLQIKTIQSDALPGEFCTSTCHSNEGYCYNGSTWTQLFIDDGETGIWEYAIFWPKVTYNIYSTTTNNTYLNRTDATDQNKTYRWLVTAYDNYSNTSSIVNYFTPSFMNWSYQFSPNVTSLNIIPTTANGTFYPRGMTEQYGVYNITNYENTTINISINVTSTIPARIYLQAYVVNTTPINLTYMSYINITTIPNGTSKYIIIRAIYNYSSTGLKLNFSWKAEK